MSWIRSARVVGIAVTAAATAVVGLATAPSALARPQHPAHPGVGAMMRHERGADWYGGSSLGTTTVTTAPGIAGTLLKAGVLPLPVLPRTGFGVSFTNGLAVSYRFPITGNTADLSAGTGDILHAGGINFVSRSSSLEIGKFDISLADGKIYATQVNFAPARIPVLDLDLSGLKVGSGPDGSTVLSGIGLNLDPAAAGALNKTFGLSLPTDGSLQFGTAKVLIRGAS